MTFTRGIFIFAFVMLIAGAVGARLIIGPLLFGDVSSPSYVVSARVPTATSKPIPSPSPRPTAVKRVAPTATVTSTTVPTPRPAATSTAVPRSVVLRPTHAATAIPKITHSPKRIRATARPTAHLRAKKHAVVRRKPTPVPTATTLPTAVPSPTPSGVVTLTNYWVGSTTAHPGTTIAVGYVIDNETGATAHIELGASVKASSQLSWATDSISDPSHDVVAVVPPGISRHVRYFTLSSRLPAGSYDIAWGLRNPSTGSRVALVAASSALRVQGIVPAP
jgi:hypothetical protein